MLGMVVKSALAFSREVSTGVGKCTPTVTVTQGAQGTHSPSLLSDLGDKANW